MSWPEEHDLSCAGNRMIWWMSLLRDNSAYRLLYITISSSRNIVMYNLFSYNCVFLEQDIMIFWKALNILCKFKWVIDLIIDRFFIRNSLGIEIINYTFFKPNFRQSKQNDKNSWKCKFNEIVTRTIQKIL